MVNGFFPLKMCYILFSDIEGAQIPANTFTLFTIFLCNQTNPLEQQIVWTVYHKAQQAKCHKIIGNIENNFRCRREMLIL